MEITLNGEEMEVGPAKTVAGLLADLELEAQKIAVERNLEIVPRSLYEQVTLEDGDRLEIVQFVGGG
ncbi:MAG: sulfur carrier protein ThiS [Pseudomonadota bacterium]